MARTRQQRFDRCLSLNFIESLLADYNPTSEDQSIVDVLELLKRFGIATEEKFKEFLQKRDKDSAKSRAKLLTHAASSMIDEVLVVRTADDLKSACT